MIIGKVKSSFFLAVSLVMSALGSDNKERDQSFLGFFFPIDLKVIILID